MTVERELSLLVSCLASSGVIGLNPDGSVWVSGGISSNGAVLPIWQKGERYATADSPMAATVRAILAAS